MEKYSLMLALALAFLGFCCGHHFQGERIAPGPWVYPTKGQIWPKPWHQEFYDGYLVVRPTVFNFEVTGQDCDLLQEAFKRYYRIIQQNLQRSRTKGLKHHGEHGPSKTWKKDPNFKAYLDKLEVSLISPCEDLPSLDMEEHYVLKVNTEDIPGGAILTSQTVWGILRGLESFSQLLIIDDSETALIVNSTSIFDYPRYPHRGLLLDTARHYLPMNHILRSLDAMEANKLNVFHWHIVDDNSFPYESAKFPELSKMGAYNPHTYVYTREDVGQVIEYARLRGIRVIPEFDSPGHTQAWGLGRSGLLTQCFNNQSKPDGTFGPVDPTNETNYEFLKEFLAEAVELFPDEYIHLGGDEVDFDCWSTNPKIRLFMAAHNMSGDYSKLEEYYVQRLVNITDNLKASSLVWQEVFDNGAQLPERTVVHIWTGDRKNETSSITKKGHRALISACWYLDYLANGGDWHKFYTCDPADFNGTTAQLKLIIGGEACMWAEFVDASNLFPRVWPRAAAAAEQLWSNTTVLDLDEADKRMEEHVCRLNRRGIPTQPANGPGFCPYVSYSPEDPFW